jgi:hypothetical protein
VGGGGRETRRSEGDLHISVAEAEVLEDDERIELPTRAVLFVERKALWAGEGGLLGATLDLDSNFNLVVSHKGADAPGSR